MHPAWFRIGGVAHDLPRGWDQACCGISSTWMPKRLDSYEKAALRNTILKGRSVGVAARYAKEALEWGTTGAGLRATGIDFDVRKCASITLATKTSTSKSRLAAASLTATPA
ncbi:hypothetical protein ACPA9J_00470 [Pseudomonas aeruginosa]